MALDGWLEKQLNLAHETLDAWSVPDRKTKPDFNRGKMRFEDKEFSLGVPERIAILGRRSAQARAALLKITALIETEAEPDIDAIHDVARDALKNT